ncbi:zinc-binding dehydrogenase [Microbacterium sp. RG1]|uniref:zinc-binding dehydrogenase n=1 Tax=Microbacterium sp. RG1 TaxID=2489212 RepID=UPI0010CA5670|nr:alcohol dehydrogenase catalytic domain-containing protein [Microbacterium sp. RG1]QCQ17728.1 zinc-binding dehydrogenase [Microbacterium sp. RG1]
MSHPTVPATMLAARFHAGERGVTLEEVPVPVPGRGDVLIEVAYCGICMSDVHMVDGTLPPFVSEVTPGHESAGTIAAVGDDVPDAWSVGREVVLTAGKRCGACLSCINGQPFDRCLTPLIMGSFYDGAWAQYVLVSFAQLVALPGGVPLDQAAVLTDAVATPYAALKDTAQLQVAESIGIWGLGGLGTHAVQLARVLGAAPIIAIDVSEFARNRALALGADAALDPADPDFAVRILELTDGLGLDVAAEFVGSSSVRNQAVTSLAAHGRVVMVGLAPDPLVLTDSMTPVMRSQSLRGHLGANPTHLRELVSLVQHRRLDVSASVTRVYPLGQIHEALGAIERREGHPVRLVLDPRGR